MFDQTSGTTVAGAASASGGASSPVATLGGWRGQLAGIVAGLRDDAQRIDVLRAMEELKCALEGEQAAVTVDFVLSQRRAQAAAGVPARHRGRGIAAQVALARRESGHRGRKHLRLAGRLATDLPYVFAALRAGRITEHKAMIVARETECLSPEDRERVDVCLAGDPAWIEEMGDRELESECKKLAYRFDPHTFVKRHAQAEADRRVTCRPAPDGMAYLTALLPLVQGVAVYATLTKYADAQRAAGDPRGRGPPRPGPVDGGPAGRAGHRPGRRRRRAGPGRAAALR